MQINTKKLIQKIIKLLLPLLFGIGIFWMLMSKVDFRAVKEIISEGISWMWVAISLTIGLFSHIVRGVRWRYQIRTLGADPSVHDMTVSVFGNYGLNLVFPRIGEVWRCNYIANNYNLSFSKTLGTMISERFADMLCSAILVLIALIFENHVFFALIAENGGIGGGLIDLITSPYFYLSIVLLVLIVWFILKNYSENRIVCLVKEICRNVWTGFLSIWTMPSKGMFIFYTFLLWTLYFLNSYTGLYFFDFTSGFTPIEGLMIFILGSISLILPVQGGLGAWHAMTMFALGCYGIGENEAFAFVTVHWCIQEGFVLLLGIYALIVVALQKREGKIKQ